MKKTFFAAITVLLALVMVTCDMDAPESNVIYDEDGNPWGVNLSIGKDNIKRALTTANAQTYTDYYEVAFMHGGKVYRTTWHKDGVGRIAVPLGDYEDADPANGATGETGAAILFAGTYANKDLLAIGLLTSVGGITTATTSVTFTLIPITNDITIGGTFAVAGAGTPADVSVPIAGENLTLPLFPVLPGVANTATWKITCPAGAEGVIIQTAGRLVPGAITVDTEQLPGITGLAITSPVITPVSGSLSPTAGVFTFNLAFTAGAGEGLAWLSIDVPVVALAATDAPGTWNIRGGVINRLFDEGATANSAGGRILIGTLSASNMIKIIVAGP